MKWLQQQNTIDVDGQFSNDKEIQLQQKERIEGEEEKWIEIWKSERTYQ